MIEFFAKNLPTIIAGAIVAAILVLVAVRLVKDRKKGRTACGCNCTGCEYSGKCSK